MTARRPRPRCAACDRALPRGRYRLCVADCGARLCRTPHIPRCTDLHAGQCPKFEPLEASWLT
ncbi:hypothetical protein ACFY8C_14555 [Streptomyces flavochromogenes]|uniref:Uncharacterized protein n=1 Tax=Streptomyces flavochromogenes TaxID=68199 RepID=A0ABW6XPY3_9ACTN